MRVRPATIQDYPEILQVRTHLETPGVLQLSIDPVDHGLDVSIREGSYPRPLRLENPLNPPDVPIQPLEDEYYAVAEDAGELMGYVRALADLTRGVGWITHIAVMPKHRRNHVGYGLMDGVRRWAEIADLHHLQAELETRNLPAYRFFQACGFRLAGYNERLNPDGSIVVFVAAPVR